ncbi:MAG: hypothetical protein K2P74_05160 [Nitrosomonas sp.]|nr:hypothetical protein [Nitrosomonas sp.]
MKLIPDQILKECKMIAEKASLSKKPTNWTATAVIIMIWLIAAALLSLWFFEVFPNEFKH